LIKETVANAFAGVPNEEKLSKVKCPHCQDDMRSINYNYSSGIMIDKCSDHGIWFDHGELEKIQINQEEWKKKSSESSGEISRLLNSVKPNESLINSNNGPSSSSFINRLINFIITKTS
jgi:Zn-finger nucleic acid-binding protein